MSSAHSPWSMPHAGVDAIDTRARGLAAVRSMFASPDRDETIVLTLDQRWCGLGLISVDGPDDGGPADDDAVVWSAHYLALLAHDGPAGGPLADARRVVMATARPGRSYSLDDADRWLEASATVAEAGLELVEWFVIGSATGCPRELVNEPSR